MREALFEVNSRTFVMRFNAMDWVNQIFPAPISVREVFPFIIIHRDLVEIETNSIDSAIRYPYDTPNSNGVDIKELISISSGNRILVSNIWKASGDSPKVGKYRIVIVPKNAAGSRKPEVNVIMSVFN